MLGHEPVDLDVEGVPHDDEDSCKLVAARGRLMSELPRDGSMLAVFADEATVRAAIEDLPGVDISGINGATETVVSGLSTSIDAVEAHFAAQDVKTRRLEVSHAFHCPLMEPMLDRFEAVARQIAYSAPQIPVISNLDGEEAGDRLCYPTGAPTSAGRSASPTGSPP